MPALEVARRCLVRQQLHEMSSRQHHVEDIIAVGLLVGPGQADFLVLNFG